MDVRPLLETLEAARGAELLAPLAYVAVQDVELDPELLHAARRRALLVLAAGGDPRRELDADAPAVARLAAELDDPSLRRRLEAALSALRSTAVGLPTVAAALDELVANPGLAVRWTAAALLAEELAEDAD